MLTHENGGLLNEIVQDNECKDEIDIDINELNDFKEENDVVKETFQCPDCPKYFEKKASLSAHYKVHTKKTKNKSNKDTKFEDGLDEVEKTKNLENENDIKLDIAKVSKVIVKEEIEVTPQIFEDRMDELDANAEWFNNDYDDSEYVVLEKPKL